MTQPAYGEPQPTVRDPPLLYQLDEDPSEKVDVAEVHSDVVGAIRQLAAQHASQVSAPPSQLELR